MRQVVIAGFVFLLAFEVCLCISDQEKELLEPVVSHLQNYVSEPSDLRVPEKSAENAQEVSVATSLGTVVGLQEYGYRVFKGIPFAQPPVDDLRWASPQPAQGKFSLLSLF